MAITKASQRMRAGAALRAIKNLPRENCSVQETLERVVRHIVSMIDADAFFAGTTDPDTGLCMGAGVVYNVNEKICHPMWEHEFLIPDYNKFADLDPADPIGDLREATGGKLSRSARYRLLSEEIGFEDELRAMLPAGGRSWGNLQLNRHAGGPPFSDDDRAFLRAAAPLAGSVLRRAMLDEPAHAGATHGPGTVVLDRSGSMIGATAEAEAWLAELATGRAGAMPPRTLVPDPRLMVWSSLIEAALSAQSTRLRTPGGTWLIAHASPLRGTDHIAMVIEPAKASEILPIVVDAYGLTRRETEVAKLVARGLSTEEMAGVLFVSRHTIRDHLKAAFEKVGVSSRGELTSKLFTEHYQAPVRDAIIASADRVAAGVADVHECA